jgi:hypothetical protein
LVETAPRRRADAPIILGIALRKCNTKLDLRAEFLRRPAENAKGHGPTAVPLK